MKYFVVIIASDILPVDLDVFACFVAYHRFLPDKL